jgi:hypothetical protein
MPAAREIALELLPAFIESVLAKRVYAYGTYAAKIGRNSAKESMVVGMGMHAIGAACVFAMVPIAPLYYVKRQDSAWRGVFEADPVEAVHVLPHYDLLYVTAREHEYTATEMAKLDRALRDTLPKILPDDYLSPHDLWRFAIYYKLKNGSTPWLEAIAHYEQIKDQIRVRHRARGKSRA